MSRSSPALFASILSFVASCATQQAAVREPNGISVVLSPEAKCSSKGSGKSPLSDTQLCEDLKTALARELTRAGFTVVTNDKEARALTVSIMAIQEMPAESPGAAVAVELRIKQGTEELDVASAQADDVTASAATDKIGSLSRELAGDLADSPRLKAHRS
jgi:hypothetical protein